MLWEHRKGGLFIYIIGVFRRFVVGSRNLANSKTNHTQSNKRCPTGMYTWACCLCTMRHLHTAWASCCMFLVCGQCESLESGTATMESRFFVCGNRLLVIDNSLNQLYMKFRFLLCFFICAFTTFAQTRDVNVLISLAYGGAETTYQIKDVQRANVIVQSANEASMTVLRKDGGTLPNIRTLIFVAKEDANIQFVNYDGTVLQSSNVAFGEIPQYAGATPTKPATAEYTYTFAGWSPSITAVTGAQTYTATYSSVKKQYEVIFKNEDGTVLQRSDVTYGETPKYNGATPTKAATAEFTYTFAGWSPSITAVTGSQTYTATFKATKRKYTLIAKPEDDAMGIVTGSGTYDYGTQVVVTATPKIGYVFEKWDNGLTEPKITIEIVGDITVIALFTENYCEQYATPEIPTMEVQPIAVWGSKLNLTESDNAIKEAISQQEGKIAEIKESWWEVNFNGTWEIYKGQIVPKQETIKVRFALTTICDKTAKGEAETLIVQCPNPENTDACKNAPSVNKYDWLLMLNVNEIKAQGYVFEEKDVTWYRITDNGAPQVVGNGYSYTIDRSLLGTGDYYARIELPTQTNDVACKCIYGTQTYSFDGDVLPTPMLMPSIVGPNERVEVLNLSMENAEIKVYDKVGKIYYTIESNGRSKVDFLSQDLPGQYLVEVKTPATKVTLKYVVR